MSQAVSESAPSNAESNGEKIINDVVIKIATTNGSGSQSANFILLRSIYKMGLPVSAKNLFPSNISGLPTWYTIRVNEDGWLAQKKHVDISIIMNKQTAEDDIAELPTGSVAIIHEALKSAATRDDITTITVPFDKLVKEATADTRLRKKVINVIYVGVVAWLLDVELSTITDSIDQQFSTKPAAANINKDAATVGYEWADQTLAQKLSHSLEPRNLSDEKIIIEGNEATALGLLFGGATVVPWYPITPSSSVCENLESYLNKYRRDPETGEATFAVVQAEDEIASIGMVLGAGWAGARAVTATSGPGISLMAEMAGLSYFAEIPAVIVNVQRMGPSTGLPTRNGQGDMLAAYHLSHGDTKHVLLIPGNMEECFSFATQSLDLAEHLQTLVFLMSDLDLGMNKWVSDTFPAPSQDSIPRGKVLTAEDLTKVEKFNRYEDVDGDGVPYRTIPGTNHPDAAYFTRGTGHTIAATYSEKPKDWQDNIDRLTKKHNTARALCPQPIIDDAADTRIAILAYGSSDFAVEEARHTLKTNDGIECNYLRLRALPLSESIPAFLKAYDTVYVVEQNRDAQVTGIIRAECPEFASTLRPLLHYDGMPLDAQTIVTAIVADQAQ